jgi:NhaP-type Na+/H+ or K+/H+ antiporter
VQTLGTHPLSTLLLYGVLVSATVVGLRLVYTLVAGALLRRSHRGTPDAGTPSWRQAAFLGWAGMRGGDSLVIALALPVMTAAGEPFPARELIIFITFVVILVTLVLQGPTLAPLIGWWGLTESGENDTEEAHARRVVAEAGLRRLRKEAGHDGVDRATASALEATSHRRVQRWSARDRERHGDEDKDHAGLAGIDGTRAERVAVAYRTLRTARTARRSRRTTWIDDDSPSHQYHRLMDVPFPDR